MAYSDFQKQHSLIVQECHAQLRSQIMKYCGVSSTPEDVYKPAGKHEYLLSCISIG